MFPPHGPFDRGYDSGIWMAIGLLWETRQAGAHEETKKFSGCQTVRALNTNMHNGSAAGASKNIVWRSEKAWFVATTALSDSEWACHFLAGCKSRLGERVKRDAAITIRQMLALQDLFSEEYEVALENGDDAERREVCEIACFFLLTFCCSLRGFEIPKIVLHLLRTKIQWEDNADTVAHMAVPL